MQRIFLLVLFLKLLTPVVYSQRSNTLFFMHSLPQANLTNPAVQIPCKVFVGFPALSSIHFNYSNTYFTYNDIIRNVNGEVEFTPDFLAHDLNSLQQFDIELHVSLINFGFLYKDYYFNFNLQDKIDFGVTYPVNFFDLALNGNAAYIGKTLDISNASLYLNYYREWAFGVSKKMNEDLTLGIKAKLLFGKANVSTSQSDLFLNTSPDIYYLNLRSEMQLRASPVILDLAPNGRLNSINLPDGTNVASFLLNRKNKGVAFDFGFIWKYNNEITLSGSLLDIGFIRYIDNPSVVNMAGDYNYRGVPLIPNLPTAFLLDSLADRIRNSYRFATESRPYNSFLPPKMYLGATYDLLPGVNAGLLVRNELYNKKLNTSATTSLNAVYKKYLGGSLSWSYINGSIINFGAGLSLRTPNFGIYAISDNVYGAFKYKSARLLNLRFGINMLFGCKECSEKPKKCAAYQDPDRVSSWKQRMKKEKH